MGDPLSDGADLVNQIPPALAIRGLRKSFGRGRAAVDDLDLTVAAGAFYALLGPNGAGKTTTPVRSGSTASTRSRIRPRPSGSSPGCPTIRFSTTS